MTPHQTAASSPWARTARRAVRWVLVVAALASLVVAAWLLAAPLGWLALALACVALEYLVVEGWRF